jgi:hypothetical protein
MYSGDFSKWVNSKGSVIPIYDPGSTQTQAGGGFTRTPFPGNQIPVSRFSAVSKQIIPFAQSVAPNRPGIVPGTVSWISNNYLTTGGDTESPTDKGSVKIDQNFGPNHRLNFFYNRTRYNSNPGPAGPSGLPQPLWNGQVSQYDSSLYRLAYDWTISPQMLTISPSAAISSARTAIRPTQDRTGKARCASRMRWIAT